MATCLCAQAGAQFSTEVSGPLKDSEKYSLRGTVVNSVTGEPVPRALVQIYWQEPMAVLTDSEGNFEFDHLPKGRFSIVARRPGFFSEQELPQDSGWRQAEMFSVGPDSSPVTVKLVPQGVLVGQVTSHGEPVPGVPVRAVTIRIVNGYKMLEQRGSDATDENGNYRIGKLVPGTYYVAAGPKLKGMLVTTVEDVKQAYAEAYYAGARDLSGATPVEVSAGGQTEADLSLGVVSVYHLSGVFVGAPPHEFPQLQIFDDQGNQVALRQRSNPVTGRFEVVVPEGTYQLHASTYGAGGIETEADEPLSVHADVSNLQVVFGPASFIPIHVQKEDVAPQRPGTRPVSWPKETIGINGKMVQLDAPAVNISLTQHKLLLQSQNASSSLGPPFDKPVLAVRGLQPGTYSAEIWAEGDWYVASAQCGSTDLLKDDLTVVAGVQPPPIEVVLRNDGAKIKGKVTSDSSFQHATVLLFPDDEPNRVSALPVFGNGEFNLQNLAPGEYTAVALDSVEGLEYANPDVIQPYLSGAVHVMLQPNQESDVNLNLVYVAR